MYVVHRYGENLFADARRFVVCLMAGKMREAGELLWANRGFFMFVLLPLGLVARFPVGESHESQRSI